MCLHQFPDLIGSLKYKAAVMIAKDCIPDSALQEAIIQPVYQRIAGQRGAQEQVYRGRRRVFSAVVCIALVLLIGG